MNSYLPTARLATLLLAGACTLGALAQSGNPAPLQPLPTHDPRILDFYKHATNTQAIYHSATHTQAPGNVAISPDGATLAWTLRSHDGSALHLTAVSTGDTSADTIVTPANAPAACSNSAPVWSPDSKTLAYTSTCIEPSATKSAAATAPTQPQIFLYSVATGESRQLTHLTGIFQQLAWAPDGKSVAFLFVENATRSAGALAAMKPWSGVIGEDGVEIQRVATVNVEDAGFAFLTPANLHAYEFGYSPDSKQIAFTAANPPGENTWWIAKLYTIANTPNATPTVAFDPNTTATGNLYRLSIPSDKKLLHKSTLCGPEDTQWLATYSSGRTLELAFFSTSQMPVLTPEALANNSNLCGIFGYAR